jgi:hypothetical protein
MTFEDLLQALPNGLHDAELVRLQLDYAKRTLSIIVDVDVSDVDAADTPRFRRAEIAFNGLAMFAIDPPGAKTSQPFGIPRIDAGPGQPSTSQSAVPVFSGGTFLCWIFNESTNGFLRVAASDVDLRWAN